MTRLYRYRGAAAGGGHELRPVNGGSLLVLGAPPPDPDPVIGVDHGFEITAENTGYEAWVDPDLGRPRTESELVAHNGYTYLHQMPGVVAGGVITGHWFKAGVAMSVPNVTFRGCKFGHGVTGSYGGNEVQYHLEWCSIGRHDGGSVGADGTSHENYTAYRCKIGGFSDGAKSNRNVRHTECFITLAVRSPDDHNDGIQHYGPGGWVTVERCAIYGDPTNDPMRGSAVIYASDGGSADIAWHDNYLVGSAIPIRAYGAGAGKNVYDIQGNWVLDNSWVFEAASISSSKPSEISNPAYITWGTERPNLTVNANGNQVAVITKPNS